MVKYPSKTYSEAAVKELWNEQFVKYPNNENDNPYWPYFNMRPQRKKLKPQSKISSDGYFIATDNNDNIIAYSGWVDRGSHWKSNGARTIPPEQNNRISVNLYNKKMKVMGQQKKPIIVVLSNKNIPEQWVSSWKGRGWIEMPKVKDKMREMMGSDEVYEYYDDLNPNVYVYTWDTMAKAWEILDKSNVPNISVCEEY